MANLIVKIRTLYQDTVAELKKCTWPTRAELAESTIVVIFSVIALSLFVLVADAASRKLVAALTGTS
ncbi:MAG: preprotein translocase subunit SecE [Lentisphaeria bacterium]|nr:preprotein translocase subunit SecE [Lentisphaeria bacterium]